MTRGYGKRRVKPMLITEAHSFFIDKICEGYNSTAAYEMTCEKYNPDSEITRGSIRTLGCRYAAKYKDIIEERRQTLYYQKQQEDLEIRANITAKEIILRENGAISKELGKEASLIAKNPMLVTQAITAGAIAVLFDKIDIKEEGKGIVIESVTPNTYAWKQHETLVKTFFENGIISKEMFKHVSERQKPINPVVANQVNLNINK